MRAQFDKSELTERFIPGHGAGMVSSHAAARIAWAIAGLSVALMALRWLLLFLTPPIPIREEAPPFSVISEVLALTFPAVGAFVASRRPHNPIGWILCGIGLLNIVQGFASAYGDYTLVARPGSLPGGEYMAWISNWLGEPGIFLAAAFLFLLFPDGHLPSRRWRFVAWMAIFGSVVLAIGGALHPHPPYSLPNVDNPVGIEGDIAGLLPAQRLWEILSAAGGTLLMVSCLASVASLILRLHRARGDERQQLKWFAYAATLMVGGVVASFVFSFSELANEVAWMAGFVGFLLLPGFIGIAILKYRLYDIDLVINRTLVYAALTAAVLALYVLVVGGLGALFQASGSLPISLLATGVVAVLFQPMRSRLQRSVNRLMYGERDDPYAVLSRLGQHLERAVAPEAALSTIVRTVAQALKLPYVAIELNEKGEAREAWEYGTPTRGALILPLTHHSEKVGQMLVAPRSPGEEFSSLDKRLLDDLARQAGAAAHAARLTADLQHSRERLVSAREEERRRLRRDLHDGLGPALGGITLGLDAARSSLPKDSYRAIWELLSQLKIQSQEAVSDIRRLVHNLRPPALDDLGLAAAIRQEAAKHGHVAQNSQGASDSEIGQDNGLTTTFTVEAPDPLPPLPAAVEVAAYRVAQEAITNVSRHAKAGSCRVVLSVDEARNSLALEVVDDGIGIPKDRRAGVGTSSMRERAEELGGSLAVGPALEGGTRILACFPLPGTENEE